MIQGWGALSTRGLEDPDSAIPSEIDTHPAPELLVEEADSLNPPHCLSLNKQELDLTWPGVKWIIRIQKKDCAWKYCSSTIWGNLGAYNLRVN